jgi:hypothetical protein
MSSGAVAGRVRRRSWSGCEHPRRPAGPGPVPPPVHGTARGTTSRRTPRPNRGPSARPRPGRP